MYEQVLIALHPEDAVEPVAKAARQLLRHRPAVILAVAPHVATSGANPILSKAAENIETAHRAQAEEKAKALADALGGGQVHLLVGNLAEETGRMASEVGADLVIKAAERDVGKHSALFANAEKKIIRATACPVLIVRPEKDHGPIAVALDHPPHGNHHAEGELMNASLLKRAGEMALDTGHTEVVLLHAWKRLDATVFDDPRSGLSASEVATSIEDWRAARGEWLEGLAADARERFEGRGLTFRTRLVEGQAERAIAEAVRDLKASALIIGTANRKGLSGLFIGNTAEGLLDEVPSSMLVVKPEGVQDLLRGLNI